MPNNLTEINIELIKLNYIFLKFGVDLIPNPPLTMQFTPNNQTDNSFNKILSKRFGSVFLLYLIIVSIALITRTALLLKSGSSFDWSFSNILGVFGIGFFYDTVMASYFCIPLVLYIWLMPNKWFKMHGHRFFLYAFFIPVIFLLLFNIISEWFFWDEFSTRYNFIAVDYLVYTTEVIGNIWESYPVIPIIIVILLISLGIFYLLKSTISSVLKSDMRFAKRTTVALVLLAVPMLSWLFVSNKGKEFSENQYAVELAGDGIYDFGAAFWNNELDYNKFYATIDQKKAFTIVNTLLSDSGTTAIPNNKELIRNVNQGTITKPYNVVLISVESLSASFLSSYGNTENLTPEMDSLAKKGILFTNLYASGTRTVRGLEALSLSIPPTPGQSIVKRPNNSDLFSLGNVLNANGYQTQYIYGGYSYFDNMKTFFSGNGYHVIDRDDIKNKKDIHYENIWGVADEDLFNLSLNTLDKNYKNGKPFFSQIMTVTNHRPFTYPDGRIDIPSKTNRQGAVKYTDYAIGKFIKDASTKPWFKNTIFIIVADHCASSAGKTELPVSSYHIPMIMYAPALMNPQIFNELTAQIDIVPTILGLLKLNYQSKFFGRDVFNHKTKTPWAFVSTYEKLGYYKNGDLLVLSPQKKVEQFKVMPNQDQIPEKVDEKLKEEAIAFYQTASYLYKNRQYSK
ncbi:LTA synthase family protein [Pedobacter arcticus]|uniref:LTA synthase family protein n=1 Tax=Pedobacter arcticus TaxID=752140 RepID=UPI00031EAFB0|nr:LTA synthase family protein [Pedobacter arcticus]